MRYRYYFFDSRAQLTGCEEHSSDFDALAIAHARELCDPRGFHYGFEVWNGFRLVHSDMTAEPGETPTAEKTTGNQR